MKSYKARGKRLSTYEVKVVTELEPLIIKEEITEEPLLGGDESFDDPSQMSLFDNGKG